MNYSLYSLFALLDENAASGFRAECRFPYSTGIPASNAQGELFGDTCTAGEAVHTGGGLYGDAVLVTELYSSGGPDLAPLPEPARRLFELSVTAFDALAHAWMSEFPIDAEMLRYGRRVLGTAAQAAAADGSGSAQEAMRQAAEQAALDRGNSDTRAVLEAAYKARHEIDRLRGLLRFTPDDNGVYIARCMPDHFVLPALGDHFACRFGDTRWLIVDEKRFLCLDCRAGTRPVLYHASEFPFSNISPDSWEDLWRRYHKTINNESRNNPDLQRRFMPKRYWKYLTEM